MKARQLSTVGLILVFLLVFPAKGLCQNRQSFYTLKNWNKLIKERNALSEVLKQMDESNPAKRMKAVKVLARFSEENQIKKTPAQTREELIKSKGEIVQAREALEHALASDPNPDIRWQAVVSLARIKDPGSIVQLERTSAKDPVEEVRKMAESTALRINFSASLKSLEKGGISERREAVRKIAELSFSDFDKGIMILAKVLNSDIEPEVRQEAAKMLRRIERPMSLSALFIARRKEPDPKVQQEIEMAIVEIQAKKIRRDAKAFLENL